MGLCARRSAFRRYWTADGRLPVRGQSIRRLRGASLGDYRGILQCDGYAGYRKLARASHSNGLRLAGCWAHLRRRFFDLHANGESVVATATVEQMKLLWAVEDEVRGQSPQARLAARRAMSGDIVRELFVLWERELPRISGKSKLAEAIRYADPFARLWNSSSTTVASKSVKSTTGAVAIGSRRVVGGAFAPPPQFGLTSLRFLSPLVKPDMRISCIRLSPARQTFALGRSARRRGMA